MKGWISTDNGKMDRVYHTNQDCQNFPENPVKVEVTDEMRECGMCKDETIGEQLEKIGQGYESR